MTNHINYLKKRLQSLRWTAERSDDPMEIAEVNSEIRRIKSDLAKLERQSPRAAQLQPA